MLKNIKIAHKIYILGFTQLFLMLIMGGIALTQMSKIGVELVDIAEKDIPLTNSISKLTEHQLEQSVLVERALFNIALTKPSLSQSNDHFTELKSHINELSITIENEINSIETFTRNSITSLHSIEAKEEYNNALEQIAQIKQHASDFAKEVEELLAFVEVAPISEITEKAYHMEEKGDELQHEVIALLTEIQNFTLKATLQAEHDEKAGITWIMVAFAVAFVTGLILPFIIGRAITKPINELVVRLEQVAQGDGDLTITLSEKAKDETGDVARAFNAFLSMLRALIGKTNVQADDLDDASEIAMKAMSETVINVDKQRSETEMVATAVNEMSATSYDVAQNAASAAEVTETVKDKVISGQHDALETQTIIKQLSQEVADASSVIQSLVQETNNIGNVLESIQGIASQTNLLALNAAIEAARAGETGRGFAVVADEVRTLAQRTQTSTVDIQELLLRLKSEANNAVISMDKGTESANLCLTKSAQTSRMFEEAAEAVITISDLNIQIATAAEQQSVVAEEVNKNLVNISNLADITAEGARVTSEANTVIAKRVVDLHANLNAFVV
ncbi:methyl-accepting chemotaxis protein [Pseudocolwellia agarivorans]|uniref:methyl-accepting chemotaxis protein n=1 Tax=Pseudocolwellia agarivorans TaxID=1911682 RepID=UPI0009879AC3|nr:methyl-accepting chemotaxis protein [Pseudocolwellia agarivorans]